MAIIKLQAPVSEIRGTIGGITYSKNGSGITARGKMPRRRSMSTKQQQQWAGNAIIVQAWRNLTVPQRADYKTYATTWAASSAQKVGRKLTAFNWFYSINYWRTKLGMAIFDTPPTHTVPTPAPSLQMALSATYIRLIAASPVTSGNRIFIVRMSLPTSLSNYVNTSKLVEVSHYNYIGSEATNYRNLYKDATGIDLCTLDQSEFWQIAFTVTVYNYDTGLFLPAVKYIFSTDTRAGGIPTMGIGSTFVVS